MIELRSRGDLDLSEIVTFNVLPGIAGIAVNGAPIVIEERTDTFDGVWLFVDRLVNWERIVRD